MGYLIFSIAVAWIGVGVVLVASTGSRGFLGDAVFLVTWPVHTYRYLKGRE